MHETEAVAGPATEIDEVLRNATAAPARAAASKRVVRRALAVGATNDRYEHEADAWAQAAIREIAEGNRPGPDRSATTWPATPAPAATGRIVRSTANLPVAAARPVGPRIQRAVTGGVKGDRVVHGPSGELFTIDNVADDEHHDRLYELVPDKGTERRRVYGDVKTYFFTRGDVAPLAALPPPNVRAAAWGSVVELAPGIGVEIMGDDTTNYVSFIRAQMAKMIATPAGAALLGQFDPRAPGGRPAQTTPPYTGLTALVAPPPDMKPNKFVKKTVVHGMKTEDVGPRGKAGMREHDAPKLPRIQFHDPAKGLQEIGDNVGVSTGAFFSPEAAGVIKHADAPNDVLPFDLALYHEFVHAFLSHAGVSGRLKENAIATRLRVAQNPDGAEEELVVGILAGKGLPMSENAYRCQRGMTLRGTYKAVGITGDPELGVDPWKPGTAPTALLDAIRNLGDFSVADASYILTGRP